MTTLLAGVILMLSAYGVFATAALSEMKKLHEVSRREVFKQDVIIKDNAEVLSDLLSDLRNMREDMKQQREIRDQFIELHRDYMNQRQTNQQLLNKLKRESKSVISSPSFMEGSE